MKIFLKCVSQAWRISHPNHRILYNSLLFEDQTEKFRIQAAVVIQAQGLGGDLEKICQKVPQKINGYHLKGNEALLDGFVSEGRVN